MGDKKQNTYSFDKFLVPVSEVCMTYIHTHIYTQHMHIHIHIHTHISAKAARYG